MHARSVDEKQPWNNDGRVCRGGKIGKEESTGQFMIEKPGAVPLETKRFYGKILYRAGETLLLPMGFGWDLLIFAMARRRPENGVADFGRAEGLQA